MSLPKLSAPVVLIHGLFGFDCFQLGAWFKFDYFHGLPGALVEAGNRVFAAKLSPTSSIACRAEQLKAFILANVPDEPVHLFAHSMGGLDSRYMITHLGMAERVLSLTTLGTPHHGSPFADWALVNLVPVASPLLSLLKMPKDAVKDLTVVQCREFNARTPNAPGVRYFSVAGHCRTARTNLSWFPSGGIVEEAEGPCDGVVSVTSATWGEACEVWTADHINLINWQFPGKPCHPTRLPQYARLMERLR